jgi:hypothetical protein
LFIKSDLFDQSLAAIHFFVKAQKILGKRGGAQIDSQKILVKRGGMQIGAF